MTDRQLHLIVKSGGFLGRFLGSLLKTGLTLMKNLLNISAKNVLIPLPLTAATSKEDEGIHKKNGLETHLGMLALRPSNAAQRTTLIISNEEMEDIIEKDKSLEESLFLMKGISETIENEAKE